MIKQLSQIHLPKPDLCCIAGSQQQEAWTPTWTLIKTKFMSFKQEGGDKTLKSADQAVYLGSNISSTENDANKWW